MCWKKKTEKKDFQKLCVSIFKKHGFTTRGNQFYFAIEHRLLVFGLQHSNFGSYYYIQYGITDYTANEGKPLPKYYQIVPRTRLVFELSENNDSSAVYYTEAFDTKKFTNILEQSILLAKQELEK